MHLWWAYEVCGMQIDYRMRIRYNYLIIFTAFILCSSNIHGQYLGGISNGFSSISVSTINLSLSDSLYNGGIGSGFSKDTTLNATLSITDSLYNGGSGNGFSKDTALNISLSVTDSLYNGGTGNGFDNFIITSANLYLLDSLYNGGVGRGEYQLFAPNINLGICGDTLVWNGNDNITWGNSNNWDCGKVPDINSIVFIPAGRPRYPVIISDIEIKTLILQPGGTVVLFSGKKLTLNGH